MGLVCRGQVRHCLQGLGRWDVVIQRHMIKGTIHPSWAISYQELQLHTRFGSRVHVQESATSCESEAAVQSQAQT